MDASDPSPDGPTHTLFHTSIKNQDFVAVQQLISLSPKSVNACCPCGVSHFLSAVASGNARMVNLLISSKANVNAFGKTDESFEEFSPLHIACVNASYDIAKIVVERGADVNARCSEGSTPMHLNARFNTSTKEPVSVSRSLVDRSEQIQTLMISKNANIDAQDDDGQTPLHVAIRYGVTTMQGFLVQNGADLTLLDKQNMNALVCAVSSGNWCIGALLLANRCPIPQYEPPLVCIAASRNGWSVLMQLLSNGANVNDTDKMGNNAIHYAITSKKGVDNVCRETHIIDKLIRRGCDPLHVNNAGVSPLQRVMRPGPDYEPSHAEFILLEHSIKWMYHQVYGSPPDTPKEMAAGMNTSWLYKDVELIFNITSGAPAYRTSPEFELLNDLRAIANGLVSDKNAKEMLADEPPEKNAKQRRSQRKADQLKLKTRTVAFLQALLRRSLTPCFARSNDKECVVCFALCSTASLPVLAPCGHRSVCPECVPLIAGVCPSCRQNVLCVVTKVYD